MTTPTRTKNIAAAAATFTLTPDEHRWVTAKWSKIRDSAARADAANHQWNKINDELNDKFRREGNLDIIRLTQLKAASIPLQDALAVGKWHAANAQRHIDDVMLFLKLKELGLL
jgi:hypothetical protein